MKSCRILVEELSRKNECPLEASEMWRWSFPSSVEAFAAKVNEWVNLHQATQYEISPQDLASIAVDFHGRAGTATSAVLRSIENIKNGVPRIVLAHQPNLLPSLGVVAPFILTENISQSLLKKYDTVTVPICLLIDYDLGDDRRFRCAHFPDPFRRLGFLPLSNGVPKRWTRVPIWTLEKPHEAVLQRWLNNISCTVEMSLTFLKKSSGISRTNLRNYREFIYHNLSVVTEIISESYSKASTLSEFTSFFLSALVNVLWRQDIVFIPGHLFHSKNANSLEFISRNSGKMLDAARECVLVLKKNGYKSNFVPVAHDDTLIWFICDKCNRRIGTKTKDGCILSFSHQCERGRQDARELSFGDFQMASGNLYPKVLADNLLDFFSLCAAGSTGYIGQAEHVIISDFILRRLGFVPFPRLIVGVRGLHYGLSELVFCLMTSIDGQVNKASMESVRCSYNAKASILYYLICLGGERLKFKWSQFFKNSVSVHRPNCIECGPRFFPDIDWSMLENALKKGGSATS